MRRGVDTSPCVGGGQGGNKSKHHETASEIGAGLPCTSQDRQTHPENSDGAWCVSWKP